VRYLPAFFLLALVGCAETNPYKLRQDALNSWVGKTETQLVETMGIADREKHIDGFRYEQYDMRCLYYQDENAVLSAGVKNFSDSMNAANGLGPRYTNQEKSDSGLRAMCDRWLFKFGDQGVLQAFAGGQVSEIRTESKGAEAAFSTHCPSQIKEGQEIKIQLKGGKSVTGKFVKCDSDIAIRNGLMYFKHPMTNVESVEPVKP